MIYNYFNFLRKLARYGVVHRDEVKNERVLLSRLLRSGYVSKVHYKGKIFYELTSASLLLLEHLRKSLFEQVQMLAILPRARRGYKALVDDIRFLDGDSPEAQEFIFLGDWQLKYPVVPSQLELARYRYYEQRGFFDKKN